MEEIIRFGKITLLSLFLFNFFFLLQRKIELGMGRMWGRRGRIPCAKARSFVRALELLLPFVAWDWGLWRRSRSRLLPKTAGSCCFELLPIRFAV